MKQMLEDKSGINRAKIEVNLIKENLYSGEIIKNLFSANQIKAFKEYEDLVNNQVFSSLDKLEEKIVSFGFKLKGERSKVYDLQIWDLKRISFKKKR